MYYFLALLTSVAVALMIFVNGYLARYMDIYLSVIVIHAVGLVALFAYLWLKKIPIKVSEKVSLWLYSGGVTGSLTTFFGVMAFGKISLSAIIALSLLGQLITSLVIDHYALFGMKRTPFVKRNAVGLLVIIAGIVVMLYGSAIVFIPALVSFLSGVSIVVARQINAELTLYCNPYTASFYNFLTGMLAAAVAYAIYALLNEVQPIIQPIHLTDSWILFGGLIGVIVVALSNIFVTKISSFVVTIITFGGQILTGLLIDFAMQGRFDWRNFLGVLFALAGLGINLLLNHRKVRKPLTVKMSATNQQA